MSGANTLGPAERYAKDRELAAQRARDRAVGAPIKRFAETLGFELDGFQRQACQSLAEGRSVLVAAPTGAGKTTVAEFALFLAMSTTDTKVFYTAPMKALSNQKFHEFVALYGPEAVGLLTGDTNINASARIVVMTTEVLRNMLYADSDLLPNLGFVVMDEVHYLADRFRGAVWEEVIIHLPQSVRLVSLSATVSNAEEFGDWLQTVRGDTDVIVSEERPVPLQQHALVQSQLIELFDPRSREIKVNPELIDRARVSGREIRTGGRDQRGRGRGGHGGRGAQRSHQHGHRGNWNAQARSAQKLSRPDLIELLDQHTLLPAIFFIFSRQGCDAAVSQVMRSGLRLTTADEREDIRAVVDARMDAIPDEDLGVLGYWEWSEALQRGIAAHHAGLLPVFKEVIEELYQRKLLKVVFATETLALGINMPARTVVLEQLEKFNGEARVPITAGEYTQLTGRAGRRGIDIEGHSVIVWGDGLDPHSVVSLASRRSYPLNSSFRPSYNMAVNLIDQFGRERTRAILESSFAQFQADRAVVGLARKVRSNEESLSGYAESMRCHLGDFTAYAALRRELSDLERASASASQADRQRRQQELSQLRNRMKQHPCHGCSDREAHARWAERWWKLRRETDALERQIRSRTSTVSKIFDRIIEVLTQLQYLESDDVVPPIGQQLKRIYGERDLLLAECLRRGVWNELDVPALAAMAAALVYEPRREERRTADRTFPPGRFRSALHTTELIWAELDDIEHDHQLPGTEPLATGLCTAMHQWARGSTLAAVLAETELAAGDFVRWTKQSVDVLDQIAAVADGELRASARAAVDAIRRGVVAS